MKEIKISIKYLEPHAVKKLFPSSEPPFLVEKNGQLEINYCLNHKNSEFWQELGKFIHKNKNYNSQTKLLILDFINDEIKTNNKAFSKETCASLTDTIFDVLFDFGNQNYKKFLSSPDFKWLIDWSLDKDIQEWKNAYITDFLKLLDTKQLDKVNLSVGQKEITLNYIASKKITNHTKVLLQKLEYSIPEIIKKASKPLDNSILDFILENYEIFPSKDFHQENRPINQKTYQRNDYDVYTSNYHQRPNNDGNEMIRTFKYYETEDVFISLMENKYSYNLENINKVRPDLIQKTGFEKILNALVANNINDGILAKGLVSLLKVFPEKDFSLEQVKKFSKLEQTPNAKARPTKIYEALMSYYFTNTKVNEAQQCFEIMTKNQCLYKRNSEVQAIEQWLELQMVKNSENLIQKKNIIL